MPLFGVNQLIVKTRLLAEVMYNFQKIEETRRSLTHNQHYSASARQCELLHSFLKKTYQVVRQSELKQLLDAITGNTMVIFLFRKKDGKRIFVNSLCFQTVIFISLLE